MRLIRCRRSSGYPKESTEHRKKSRSTWRHRYRPSCRASRTNNNQGEPLLATTFFDLLTGERPLLNRQNAIPKIAPRRTSRDERTNVMRVCASVCVNFASFAVVLDIFPLSSLGRDETPAEAGTDESGSHRHRIRVANRGNPRLTGGRFRTEIGETARANSKSSRLWRLRVTARAPSLIRFNESVAPSEDNSASLGWLPMVFWATKAPIVSRMEIKAHNGQDARKLTMLGLLLMSRVPSRSR